MLEELQTLALVGLLVSTYFLTIGCRNISESMPHESGIISGKVEGMTEVLDDIADLLNEAMHAVGNSAIAQTPSSPMEAILSGLISSITAPKNHGPTTQERTIHEIDPTPNESQTENESN
jgi:hypothetical protein